MHNKTKLVDIINLNSYASCLSTKRWDAALRGGIESELFQILNSYILHDQKINIGIIGSTLAEIESFNPECIALINDNPANFEILVRPYVHSLSILWNDRTFLQNYSLGREYITRTFDNIVNWYLPPEFALRNSHLFTLAENNNLGTFIHPKRVKDGLKTKLPKGLFNLKSIQDSNIECITLTDDYDKYYLELLQLLDSEIRFDTDWVFGWRDGESPFFLPDSVAREEVFIKKSKSTYNRVFLSEYLAQHQEPKSTLYSYPQNSLNPWLGNFRLRWYIDAVKEIERNYETLSPLKKFLFLNLLNSDILSSQEKNDVFVPLKNLDGTAQDYPHKIKRKERNLNAEEVLFLIHNRTDEEIRDFINSSENLFIRFLNTHLTSLQK